MMALRGRPGKWYLVVGNAKEKPPLLAVRVVRDKARDGDLLPAAIDDRNGGGDR
ncbi:MAG: hypothetical protein KGJ96_12635 [Xanthomonadaceae bacterium]|nr:hypothetical protein [Xanthomonadaceae bacterium]